jgi:peroxiredoxin
MRRYLFILLSSLISLHASAQGYKISLKTPSFDSGKVYLTYHMGKNLNIADSGFLKQGKVIFQKADTLPSGIYAIVFPGKRHSFDFFIDKSFEMDLEADTADLLNVKVKGSPENPLFQEYQKLIAEKGKELQLERLAYENARSSKDSTKHEDRYKAINKELNEYRAGIISNQPSSMMALLLKAMKEPEVPIKKPLTRQDSLDNYYYYKAHFWDGVSFMDSRVIRTPFFLPRLEQYYRNLMPQEPDSIIRDIDYKLLLARNAPEMFKFLLNWLTDEYLTPKYMGQDAVFVHLFNKYHSKGLSPWLNEKQMETISRRAYMQMANLLGEKAADLNMVDTAGKPSSLYSLQADYTVVVFWDPSCGHCKEEVPRIDSVYKASWKKRNVKLYGVLSENDKVGDWIKFINQKGLNEWTHVYETKEAAEAIKASQSPSYKQLYDVISTPTIYLLDQEKRIVGKKLNWSQLNDLLQVKWNQKNKS